MLKDNFFTIQEIKEEEDGLNAKVLLKKDHEIYNGHFPGNPVVPGVCLVQIIKELVEGNLNQKLNLKKADNIKFMNFVNPLENELLVFTISVKKDGDVYAKATISFEDKIFLKFGGSFIEEGK
jgi:3-hydroxyacyl-[acyl-carrier-protein] dehydratase